MSFNPETGGNEAPRLKPALRKSNKKLFGALGGAALALAVAFGGASILGQTPTTNAQTSTPSQTASPSTPSTGSGSKTAPTNNGQTAPQDNNGKRGGFAEGGRPGPAGMGGPGGTISAISGNTITIKHGDNITTTVTVNDSTVYTEAGKKISLSDLAVGERVNVRTTKASDGTVTVAAIDVVLDHAGGTISAVDANGLTLTGPNNTTVKVTFGSSVTVQDAGKTVSASNLATGERVEVAGQKNSDGSITAQVINVQHDRLGGKVTAINGNTITVKVAGPGRGGPGRPGGPGSKDNNATPSATPSTGSSNSSTPVTATKTITVNDSTTYLAGGQSSQLSAIAVGDRINAEGTLSSDGNSLTALQVNIELPRYMGKVTSVNGSTIVIDERGTSRTIEVTANTKYQNGPNSASLSDVKTDAYISAEGTVDSSGKMTAAVVNVGGPAGPGMGGPGFPGGKMGPGGMGGHHGGR